MMKKKWLKIAACLLAGLSFGLTFVGCDNGDVTSDSWSIGDETEEVTLKFTHIWSEHAETFETICENFETLYSNVKILPNIKTHANISSSLKTSWGSSQFPDVGFYWTHSMSDLVNSEVQMAADLTQIYYEKHKDEFIGDGDCFRSGFVNNKVYNVPFRATGFVIYYNKTIMDDLDLDVPTTLEEFVETLAAIKENSDLTPLACYGATGTYYYIVGALNNYYDILVGKASDPNYRTDRLSYVSGEAEERTYLYETVREWTKNGYFGSNPLAGSTESVETAFLNETCVMAMLNNNSLEVIQEEMPNAEIGCISLPAYSTMENPESGYVSGGYDGFFISNSCKNKNWALKFIEYLNSEEVQQLFADEEGAIMSRKDVEYSNALQQQVADCMKNVGRMGAFADYVLSTSATASSVALNSYLVDKNGDYDTCLSKLNDAYNAKRASVEDIMINPQRYSMITPVWTRTDDKLTPFMNWCKSFTK